jgi:hypothetical protein
LVCAPGPAAARDGTGGRSWGRLCIVYRHRTNSVNVDDTDIYVIHSDNSGTNWSSALKVNTDNTTTSQFFPRIAVDQTSGKVAVSWYDCRADTVNNRKTQLYAAVSSDGGATFSSNNLLLQTGQSDIGLINPDLGQFDYYDYSGSAFYGGHFYSAWADNSTNAPGNPDGTCGMDILVVKVKY